MSSFPNSDESITHCSTSRLLILAQRALRELAKNDQHLVIGKIRGTGPDVHFGSLINDLDIQYPVHLKFPFENSDRVGGGIWGNIDPQENQPAIAKLQWLEQANDLPMHIHEHADRFIVVIGGRGFFHWSDQGIDQFDGSAVNTIAARDRDVFAFSRGLTHTFSTAEHAMTLLSIQSPFIPFDDDRQYRLPANHWTAQGQRPGDRSILCVFHTPSTDMTL